jgi:probable F420-dependent oxidoreductase
MKVGALIPMMDGVETPADTIAFARLSETLGYDFLAAYEHVIVGDPAGRPQPRGSLTPRSLLHESLTLIAFLAASTTRMEFCTEIIVSPQRQTVLLAKQAAEVDYLSSGRLRLGIGAGWNPLEFEAQNEDFSTRGARMSEQIDVMRALWTHEVVDFQGRWHRIDRAGLMPKPAQGSIPIWIGGSADAALKRIAEKGDGWLPLLGRPGDDVFRDAHMKLQRYIGEAGRKPTDVGLEGAIYLGRGTRDEWIEDLAAWRDLGATHLTVRSAGAGFTTLDEHLDALQAFTKLL